MLHFGTNVLQKILILIVLFFCFHVVKLAGYMADASPSLFILLFFVFLHSAPRPPSDPHGMYPENKHVPAMGVCSESFNVTSIMFALNLLETRLFIFQT